MKFTDTPIERNEKGQIIIKSPINWNHLEEPLDLEYWNKLVSQFWVPEKIAFSNDMATWNTLTDDERDAINKVFANLTLLDTVAGCVGTRTIMGDAVTMHEASVFGNMVFMEAFDGSTELLTPTGWKKITDVTVADKVAQFDGDTKQVTFVSPKLVPSHFAKERYEISINGQAKQIVSPGHRVYFERLTPSGYVPETCEAKDFAKLVKTSSEELRMRGAGVVTTPAEPLTPQTELRIIVDNFGNIQEDTDGIKWAAIRFPEHWQTDLFKKFMQENLPRVEVAEREDSPASGTFFVKLPETVANTPLTMRDQENNPVSLVRTILKWHVKNNEWTSGVFEYTAPNEELAEFMYTTATLAGLGCEKLNSLSLKVSFRAPVYDAKKATVQKLPGAEVYCVQVPSTFLLTRFENSSPIISGNCVHAKNYSTINSTFLSSEEIEKYWEWTRTNKQVQYKSQRIQNMYYGDDPNMRKIANVLLESFLFYSGFYLPLYFGGNQKITQIETSIRLIMRDESIHGVYTGSKFLRDMATASPEYKAKITRLAYDLFYDLYANEQKFIEDIYTPLNMAADVKKFLNYNANRAFQNLGFEPLFTKPEEIDFSPVVLAGLDLTSSTHDFFSSQGSSYFVVNADTLADEDFADMDF